jgi:hypothetical protein
MEDRILTYPETSTATVAPNEVAPTKVATTEVDEYLTRLVEANVNTKDKLSKMSDDKIRNLYLKHNQKVVDQTSAHTLNLGIKGYIKFIKFLDVIPLDDIKGLEESLNNDVFLKAFVDKYLPPIYYRWGAFLGPASVALTTATHVDYKQLKDKSSAVQVNGREANHNSEEREQSAEEREQSAAC